MKNINFKNNKAITLISATIYIIAFLMIVSVMTVIAGYFYTNTEVVTSGENFEDKFIELNSYMAKEVNEDNCNIVSMKTLNEGLEEEQTYILFGSGNQYSYIKANKSVYVNYAKMFGGIDNCEFLINEEGMLEINITVGEETKTVKYSINGN